MFRILLETCRVVGDSKSASRVQEDMKRLGLLSAVPLAMTRGQRLEWQYETETSCGDDVETEKLWLVLRQHTAYLPQLQVLPWAFTQNSTREQQEESLMLHTEKASLAVLLTFREAMPTVAIDFGACMDCHEFFKSSSLLLRRRIQLRQAKMVHVFADGSCSCNDRWWQARLTPPGQTLQDSQDADYRFY